MSQVRLKIPPIAKRCLELQEECVTFSEPNKLLMEEILHQLIGSLSYYLQGFTYIPGG